MKEQKKLNLSSLISQKMCLILLGLLVLAHPSLSILKKQDNIGHLVVGDEIYVDAENFLNHDFKQNPGYFVYPTGHQSAFEMYSVPQAGVSKLPIDCERAIVAFKGGVLFQCRRKLKVYSSKEGEVINEFALSETTQCGGYYKIPKRSQFITVCRKSQGTKESKLYIVTVNYSKTKEFGQIKISKNPLTTTNLNKRMKFLGSYEENMLKTPFFWSAPDLDQLGKVTRYRNNRLFVVNPENHQIEEVNFDFSTLPEEMVNFNYAQAFKIKTLPSQQDAYIVLIRGFYNS